MPELIDGLPFVEHDGVPRKLAWLHEEDDTLFKALPSFEASGYPVLAESDLREVDHFVYGIPVKDQGRFGSCTDQALVSAYMNRWALLGRDVPALSSTWNYANINRGKDQGASLSGILQAGVDFGFCLESQCPQDCVFLQNVRDVEACRRTAQVYRMAADGYFRCSTYRELLSAVVLGFPVGFGILVGDNFDQVDGTGLCPLPDQVRGGHALCGGRTRKGRTGWELGFVNSWTLRFGINGYAWLQQRHFDQRTDAWALVRPADVDGQDFDKIPHARTA